MPAVLASTGASFPPPPVRETLVWGRGWRRRILLLRRQLLPFAPAAPASALEDARLHRPRRAPKRRQGARGDGRRLTRAKDGGDQVSGHRPLQGPSPPPWTAGSPTSSPAPRYYCCSNSTLLLLCSRVLCHAMSRSEEELLRSEGGDRWRPRPPSPISCCCLVAGNARELLLQLAVDADADGQGDGEMYMADQEELAQIDNHHEHDNSLQPKGLDVENTGKVMANFRAALLINS